MISLPSIATLLLSIPTASQATPLTTRHNQPLIGSLPSRATDLEYKYQPVLDFDHDGCYQASAIDATGQISPGLKPTGARSGSCRDPAMLAGANTYSRARCNGDICAIVYAYYFPKDQTTLFGCAVCGHRHDWEHVVVIVRRSSGNILRVAASHHYAFWVKDSDFKVNGTHPMVNYHKDGALTHALRLADDKDLDHVQNHLGYYYRAPLVGWHGFPSEELRTLLNTHDFEGPTIKTTDEHNFFVEILNGVRAKEFDFNPTIDEWEPLTHE